MLLLLFFGAADDQQAGVGASTLISLGVGSPSGIAIFLLVGLQQPAAAGVASKIVPLVFVLTRSAAFGFSITRETEFDLSIAQLVPLAFTLPFTDVED